jgi:hypothetical protein
LTGTPLGNPSSAFADSIATASVLGFTGVSDRLSQLDLPIGASATGVHRSGQHDVCQDLHCHAASERINAFLDLPATASYPSGEPGKRHQVYSFVC